MRGGEVHYATGRNGMSDFANNIQLRHYYSAICRMARTIVEEDFLHFLALSLIIIKY